MTVSPVPSSATHWATRASFLVAGLGMSAWAPLVPFAQSRMTLNEGQLGLLLLCLGLGSLLAMAPAGALIGRLGCRRVILGAGGVLTAILPALAYLDAVPLMALGLLIFGAALGLIDVAINVHAVIVEQRAGRPMMSGFHALFSVGGIVGAAIVGALLTLGLSPLAAVIGAGLPMVALLLLSAPALLTEGAGGGPVFAWPRGPVVVLGVVCFVMFLSEGAMLDWSGLFLTRQHGFPTAQAGIGYAAFAAAMTCGRFSGDRLVRCLGGARILIFGGLLTAAGFIIAVLMPSGLMAIGGFVLIGLGSSNIVPVLFTAAGRQQVMPVNLAIAAMTTLGYSGILSGPALIGLIADLTSLPVAFSLIAALVLVSAAQGRRVAGVGGEPQGS